MQTKFSFFCYFIWRIKCFVQIMQDLLLCHVMCANRCYRKWSTHISLKVFGTLLYKCVQSNKEMIWKYWLPNIFVFTFNNWPTCFCTNTMYPHISQMDDFKNELGLFQLCNWQLPLPQQLYTFFSIGWQFSYLSLNVILFNFLHNTD